MADREQTDILVFGDEVESILTAVSAARTGAKVTLIRRSMGLLGGLSTRGGLAYMDITPDRKSPIFHEFLSKAGVKRVALEPHRAHLALEALILESGITVHHGATYNARYENKLWVAEPYRNTGEVIEAKILIDATPDADIARWLKLPFIPGLGNLIGPGMQFLGVSPVFRLHNVPVPRLREFEASLREKKQTRDLLESAMPFHSDAQKDDYITRQTYSPDGEDYLDILNPTIGVYYHLWRHGEVSSYSHTFAGIDGANIALMPDGSMAFNGLVFQMGYRFSDEACMEALLAYSHGAAIPEYMEAELRSFERWLRTEAGFSKARIALPEDLYVRHTLTMLSKNNMTAEMMIKGGVPKEKAIGTASYWLDFRGITLAQKFPELIGQNLPKPVFNVGLDVALPFPGPNAPENFAFVSRSAGYSPLGQGAGRIVQHNVMLGEAVGIAAALAVLTNTSLNAIAEKGIEQVREVIDHRNGEPVKLEGQKLWTDSLVEESDLLSADNAIVAAQRNELAPA